MVKGNAKRNGNGNGDSVNTAKIKTRRKRLLNLRLVDSFLLQGEDSNISRVFYDPLTYFLLILSVIAYVVTNLVIPHEGGHNVSPVEVVFSSGWEKYRPFVGYLCAIGLFLLSFLTVRRKPSISAVELLFRYAGVLGVLFFMPTVAIPYYGVLAWLLHVVHGTNSTKVIKISWFITIALVALFYKLDLKSDKYSSMDGNKQLSGFETSPAFHYLKLS